ncbi:MAG: YXWGXW repeat-containing protein [Candidatus Eisenbacteria bacterium]|nr:YXWGXW repeat-containing protein [Candidatus Eisenbacteria bacterium]
MKLNRVLPALLIAAAATLTAAPSANAFVGLVIGPRLCVARNVAVVKAGPIAVVARHGVLAPARPVVVVKPAAKVWVPGHYTWRNHHRVWVAGHWR